eukprot:959242-Pelagomonas_calceolata.AAC.12
MATPQLSPPHRSVLPVTPAEPPAVASLAADCLGPQSLAAVTAALDPLHSAVLDQMMVELRSCVEANQMMAELRSSVEATRWGVCDGHNPACICASHEEDDTRFLFCMEAKLVSCASDAPSCASVVSRAPCANCASVHLGGPAAAWEQARRAAQGRFLTCSYLRSAQRREPAVLIWFLSI